MFDFMTRDFSPQGKFQGMLQHVQQWPCGKWVGQSVTTGASFVIQITPPAFEAKSVVLMDWEPAWGEKGLLRPTAVSTYAWIKPGVPQPLKVVELCSGLGFMGEGFKWCGYERGPTVELSRPVCELLSQARTQVFQCDVSTTKLPVDLLLAVEHERFAITGGFACQPWSKMGDGKGLEDDRAKSLAGVLRVALYTDPVFVMLENVVACFQDPQVVSLLERICKAKGWGRKLLKQDLHRDWCTQRARMWLVMGPTFLIHDLHLMEAPTETMVPGHVMPSLHRWPSDQQEQLTVAPEEIALFAKQPNAGEFVLHPHNKPKTLLHSLGSLTDACPCECRSQGLSTTRLVERGVSTLVIQQDSIWRYPHPAEAALLQAATIPDNLLKHVTPQRFKLALTQLGQLASPLHSGNLAAQVGMKLKVIAHIPDIRRHLVGHILRGWHQAKMTYGAKLREGDENTQSWVEQWLQRGKQDGQAPAVTGSTPPNEIHTQYEQQGDEKARSHMTFTVKYYEQGTITGPEERKATLPCYIRDVLEAEQVLTGTQEQVIHLRDEQGNIIATDAHLQQGRVYIIQVGPEVKMPPDNYTVQAYHGGEYRTTEIKRGDRLFDLNSQLGLARHTRWYDEDRQWLPRDMLVPQGRTLYAQPCEKGRGEDIHFGGAAGGHEKQTTNKPTGRDDIVATADRLSELARLHQGTGTSPREECPRESGTEWIEWRLQKAIEYGTWVGTDEMQTAVKAMRHQHACHGFLPVMTYQDGRLDDLSRRPTRPAGHPRPRPSGPYHPH